MIIIPVRLVEKFTRIITTDDPAVNKKVSILVFQATAESTRIVMNKGMFEVQIEDPIEARSYIEDSDYNIQVS